MPTLMERQLDEVAGKLLQKSLEAARPALRAWAARRRR
jgi:NAD(P)H-nitrite reductase large subunit